MAFDDFPVVVASRGEGYLTGRYGGRGGKRERQREKERGRERVRGREGERDYLLVYLSNP